VKQIVLSDKEFQDMYALLDFAVKSAGLSAVKAAAPLIDRMEAAVEVKEKKAK
jgi:hypothetical protein